MDDHRRLLPAAGYRREARRLRARHSTDPGRLYGALRDLAREQDRVSVEPPQPRMRLVDDAEVAPAKPQLRDEWAESQFLAEIRSNIQDGILRYSQRQMLLHRADGLGLHRFRANLLLAMVLHELNVPTPVRATRVGQNYWLDITPPQGSDRRLKVIGLLDLMMAIVFAASLFAGSSIWPPEGVWDYLALGSGTIVFAICPVLFWRIQRASKGWRAVD